MTDEQLAAIEERVNQATPGPWFPIVTDDELSQGAVYVCRQARGQKRDGGRGLYLDGGRARRLMVEGNIDDEQVMAITCLQSPQLAYQDASDENALFIAHAREDVPALLAEIRRLRQLLDGRQSKPSP